MSLQKIPLSSSPNQAFLAQLTVDSKPLSINVSLRYNEMASYWVLALSDSNGNLLVDSIPGVTGSFPAANLLEQHRYLGIGSWYIVNASNLRITRSPSVGYGQEGFGGGPYGGDRGSSRFDYPDFTNLGSDFELWIDDTPSF